MGASPTVDFPARTERLTIRLLNVDDLDSHHRLFSDPEVVRYLYDDTLTIDEAREHLARRTHSELRGEGLWTNFAVELAGRLIGEVGVTLTSAANRQAEIGYVFFQDVGGRGLATEAAAMMVDVAIEAFGAHRITGRLDARNERSAALLRRLGFRHEGTMVENEYVKGEWTDEAVYGTLDREWRQRRAR
jgi:RimJ/RimL family protein N-acetyltransferase